MDFKPHPVQWQALRFKTQFAAAICGSQSGKTTVGAVWAGMRIQEQLNSKKPMPGLIGAPTYKIMNQSTLQKFWEQFPHLQQYHKRQESVIEVPYTNKKGENKIYPIFIRSFDRPLTVEGMSPGWAWLDEFGQCDSLAWTVVKTRMTVTGGKIFITTTPYNMGFLHREVYQPVKEGIETRMSLFNWSAYDLATFFEREAKKAKGEQKKEYELKAKAVREHLDSEKKALPPEMFASRYMGHFSRMTGLVYNLHEEQFVPREDIDFERVIGGIDWGYHHPALGVYGLKGDVWYVIGEWAETQKTEEEVIQAAKNLQLEYNVSKWYADSAAPQSIKAANRGTGLYVVGFQKKKKSLSNDKSGNKVSSIAHGVSFIQQLARERRLRVFDDCVLHRDEFMSYHYPEEPRPGYEDIPEKGNDHHMDAMRYAIMGYAPTPRPQARTPKGVLYRNEQKRHTFKYEFT
jgi:hypothetical protein